MHFDISNLVPLETEPRYESLEYFTHLFRERGSLNSLLFAEGLWISFIDQLQIVRSGNMRTLWYTLNGVARIYANVEEPHDGIKQIVEDNKVKGVTSFYELASKVKNKQKFIIPNFPSLSFAEFQRPKYY